MDIPETVILDLQTAAYARKKALVAARDYVAVKENELAEAKQRLSYEERALREIAEFLSKHNGQCGDWLKELGL